jgi:hypothetical protein
MRKIGYLKNLFIISFIILPLRAAAPDITVAHISPAEPICPYVRIMKAVVDVESNGDTTAFNADEGAIGAFQIRSIRVRDYNRRTGSNIKPEDCYSFSVSQRIFLFYAEEIGYRDYEKIAKNWNGSGKATEVYWERVRSKL